MGFAFNNGKLEKDGEEFVIKGLNYSPTPPGFNPNDNRPYDALNNVSQVKWFAEEFSAIGGNAIRVYFNWNQRRDGTNQVNPASVPELWRKSMDILHDHGIYILINLYVNFTWSDTPEKLAQYKNNQAEAFVAAAQLFGDHPAVMGYLFGNETNANRGSLTLDQWWEYANDVAGELKCFDEDHIVGISSGMSSDQSIAECVAAEHSGKLGNFDFHGSNTYRGKSWNKPSTGTTSFFSQWQVRNKQPIIITETGVDAYNNTTGQVDENAQVDAVVDLWNTFDRTKCPGIFFFAAFDELYKGGTAGVAGDNATTHGTAGYPAATDSFYMHNDQFANEQYFGWWTEFSAMPNQHPPTARKVVEVMETVWL